MLCTIKLCRPSTQYPLEQTQEGQIQDYVFIRCSAWSHYADHPSTIKSARRTNFDHNTQEGQIKGDISIDWSAQLNSADHLLKIMSSPLNQLEWQHTKTPSPGWCWHRRLCIVELCRPYTSSQPPMIQIMCSCFSFSQTIQLQNPMFTMKMMKYINKYNFCVASV